MDPAVCRRLKCRSTVGMLGDDVRALIHQYFGRVGFFGRIKPTINPHDFYLHVRIDRLRTQHECIDAAHDFGNRERGDVADDATFGYLGGNLALHITAFVEAR